MPSARRLRSLVVGAAVAALTAATVAVPTVATAGGADLLMFSEDGNDKVSVGANSVVSIWSGAVRFLPVCEPVKDSKPVNDFAFPISDVYLVKHGSVSPVGWGTKLEDVNGMPNTVLGLGVSGAFIEEQIAVTKPAGKLDAGVYDLIYDNCQDGVYDWSNDSFYDSAVTVTLPAVLPPISPSLQGIKAPANEMADRFRVFAKDLAKRVGGEAYAKCFDAPTRSRRPSAASGPGCRRTATASRRPYRARSPAPRRR